MNEIGSIIEQFGGPSKLAKALGCEPQVVCNWRARGFIHWRWHDQLLGLARNNGTDLTRDQLQKRYPVKPQKRRAA